MYTRRGDRGETSLYGPRRVAKDSPRVEAYGTIDELNSYIGVVLSDCRDIQTTKSLKVVQRLLFVAGADLAADSDSAKVPRISKEDTATIEKMTDEALNRLPALTNFILPGGSRLASELQYARAICRRAERRALTASKAEKLNSELIPFLNRLSSYLFNLGRLANQKRRVKEDIWKG
ncbi:MAG: cob(I)yrinic acid a,c-diamide adenosyltransferase [Nitrososphaerales archaeon]|nr:cob(I)yrinic acid a,c-diamide adenosyltransferase [Nitrososphaerales archaeon]